MTNHLPVIDMGPLFVADDTAGRKRVAGKIARACRAQGMNLSREISFRMLVLYVQRIKERPINQHEMTIWSSSWGGH